MAKIKRLLMFFILTLGLIGAAGVASADPQDVEGGKDPSYLNRMPGYYIYEYIDKAFDSIELKTGEEKTARVEGRHYTINYGLKDDAEMAGPVQIVRNYTNALKKSGGQVVFATADEATLKVAAKNVETWVYVGVYNSGEIYRVDIVEKQTMKQDILADAASLAQAIKETGKAAVYGIYFDTGKSVVKPESGPALQEIARLLKGNPALKLYVVGHTDTTGVLDANMKLSRERSAAVVKALQTQYGISAPRLMAFGVGPLAPAAANLTEEGRAKNRRVELVAQ